MYVNFDKCSSSVIVSCQLLEFGKVVYRFSCQILFILIAPALFQIQMSCGVFIDWFKPYFLIFDFKGADIYKTGLMLTFTAFCVYESSIFTCIIAGYNKREREKIIIAFFSSTDCRQLCNFCRAVCSDSCCFRLANVGEQEQLERIFLGEHL